VLDEAVQGVRFFDAGVYGHGYEFEEEVSS